MTIQYTYEIISVDQASRCMEIVYSSNGRKTMHIGARLPYAGESLEDVVKMYSPVNLWLEQERPVAPPKIGVSGAIVFTGSNAEFVSTSENQFAATFPTEAIGSIGSTTFE